MTLGDLLPGDAVFVDANTLTHHFEPNPRWLLYAQHAVSILGDLLCETRGLHRLLE